MGVNLADEGAAMDLLERMFAVEMDFLKSDMKEPETLASAFHPDVVVHEPGSLPYAGDWRGLDGVAALLRKMGEAWSEVSVDGLEAARLGDTVFMACTLRLTARTTGTTVTQPFAERLRFKEGRLLEGTPFYYDTHELIAAVSGSTPPLLDRRPRR